MMENQPVNSIANSFPCDGLSFSPHCSKSFNRTRQLARLTPHILAVRCVRLPNHQASEKPSFQGMAAGEVFNNAPLNRFPAIVPSHLRDVASQVLFCHSNATGSLIILAG
jgi:hypothetical protein